MSADDQNEATANAPARSFSTAAELEAEVRRLAPFHHDIALPFGVRTHVPDLARRTDESTRHSGR
ncbi:MAG: hypothetical protein WD715_10095 [Dongiaceae bacterium]